MKLFKLLALGVSTLALTGALWLAKAPAQPSSAQMTAAETQQLLTKKGLPELLDMLNQQPQMKLPSIHTQPYCSQLPPAQQGSCSEANALGGELYKALRTYQYKIKGMPIKQFGEAIGRLALLRDKLWQTKSMGGVLLADLTNRLIFWRLADRMTTGPLDELKQLDAMRVHYKALIADWKTFADAAAKEVHRPIDYAAIEDPITKIRKPKKGDWSRTHPDFSALTLRYADVYDQLRLAFKESDFNRDASIPTVLQHGNIGWLVFWKPAGVCQISSYPSVLRYYVPLMKQMRQQKEFAAGLTTTVTRSISQGDVNRRRGVLARRFAELVPVLIPQAVGRKLEGCGRGLGGFDFQRISEVIERQNNWLIQYRDTESNAKFEFRFP